MHIKLSDLPEHLSIALKRTGHTRHDIELVPSETVDSPNAGRGMQGIMTAINLSTGSTEQRVGSFGGMNMFEKRGADYVKDMDIPIGYAVYVGYSGYKLGGYGRLYLHPSNVSGLSLPVSTDLTEDELKALYVMRALKPAYRGEWLAKKTGGRVEYTHNHTIYQKLASDGLVKVSKNGAMRITTDGKNAVADCRYRT